MTERFGKARVEKIGRIWVLYLKGTPFERGFQHGTLMRYVARTSVDFYRNLPSAIISRVTGKDITNRQAFRRIKRHFLKKLISLLDQEVLEEIRGLSVGLGMKMEDVAEAAMISEIIQCSQKIVGLIPFMPRFWIPGVSGTTVIRESTGGSLFMGRNFDFWGAGYWDENPAVIFHYPDKGKVYCVISTAGFPLAGYTAINEDGLSLSATALVTHAHDAKGKPAVSVTHELVRKSSTINDALSLLDNQKMMGSWSFALAGGSELEAAVMEVTPRKKTFRKLEDHSIVITERSSENDPTQNSLESVSHILSSKARNDRALFLLRHLKITTGRIADILSDHFDPLANEYRSAGFTISRISTLSSSVFCLHTKRFYVSESKAPSAQGGFVGFELGNEFHEEVESVGRIEISDTPEYRVTASRDYYIKASFEYLSSADLNRVLSLLGQCVAIDPSESTYHFLEGIFRTMVGNYKGAVSSLDSALELERVEHKKDIISLWKARVYDLLERREISTKAYAELMEKNTFESIKRSASRCRRKPFSEKDLSMIFVDFANGDTIEPWW